MKYFALFLFCSTLALGGTNHKFILEFSEPVDPAVALSDFDVTGWKRLGNKSVYRVKINSQLQRSQLLNQIYSQMGIQSAEDDQNGSVVTLESLSTIEGRVMTLDEVSSSAIIGAPSTEGGEVNTRWIFIIDSEDEHKPLYDQYHMTSVRADLAWEHADGKGIKVAVLDTGVDMDHPFLAGNLVPGYDFVDNDNNPDEVAANIDSNQNGTYDDGYGHGSHVAGILKSVAPGVGIMPVRVADSDGHASLFDIIQGIDFAVQNGAKVINLSMSISSPSSQLEDALDRARMAGVVVVTSAGNENSRDLMYPASESEVLTVTSVDSNYQKSSYANYGRKVDVAAPGDYIISAMPGGDYVARSGTSMAAPIVAAEAAIVFELVPSASIQYVRHRITNNVKDISRQNQGFNNKLGKGLADVWDAITVQSQQ